MSDIVAIEEIHRNLVLELTQVFQILVRQGKMMNHLYLPLQRIQLLL